LVLKAPPTLKNLSEIEEIPRDFELDSRNSSISSLVVPYTLIGLVCDCSVRGIISGLPYTVAVEANINLLIFFSTHVCIKFKVPVTFTCLYKSGYDWPSSTLILAAKCTTASTPSSA